MIRADNFMGELRRAGFAVFSGTPCSYLTPLINRVIDTKDIRYVGAANEGDAVAIACGAELGGAPSAILFQNSGLGNAVNPLTSLTVPLHIPVLILTTWRGQPGGPPDEPQHELMGRITHRLLDLMEIPWEEVPPEEASLAAMLERAVGHMLSRRTPYALILRDGIIQDDPRPASVNPRKWASGGAPTRPTTSRPLRQDDALCAIRDAAQPSDVLLATTGYTGRALYALGDRANQLYMVGSMGCVSSLGLGLALAQPRRRVIVIDGDGAVLMRMGALATIGHERPPNLIHVLLDNGVHDSTGGQATVSATTDLAAVARACGYPRVVRADGLEDLQSALRNSDDALTFVHVTTTARENRKLPRPDITPAQVAERFRQWLRQSE